MCGSFRILEHRQQQLAKRVELCLFSCENPLRNFKFDDGRLLQVFTQLCVNQLKQSLVSAAFTVRNETYPVVAVSQEVLNIIALFGELLAYDFAKRCHIGMVVALQGLQFP